MALGVYKPGQGYWVRVLSAVGAGTLVLATAMWIWGQAGTIDMPRPTWTLTLESVRGDLSAGDAVELQTISPSDPTQRELKGTATVISFTPDSVGGGEAVIGTIAMQGAVSPADATFIAEAGSTGSTLDGGGLDGDLGGAELGSRLGSDLGSDLGSGLGNAGSSGLDALGGSSTREIDARVVAALGTPIVEQLYVQAALASVVILLGAILIFVLVGSNKNSAEFLIATDGEMKKVNWSTRREVMGSTGVVIFAAFLIAALLYTVDIGFNQFFGVFGLHG